MEKNMVMWKKKYVILLENDPFLPSFVVCSTDA